LGHEERECGVLKEVERAFAMDDDYEDILAVLLWRRKLQQYPLFEKLCCQNSLEFSIVDQNRVKEKCLKLDPEIDVEVILSILGRIRANVFGLDVPMTEGEFNEDGEPDVSYLGRCMYLEGSFFNHNCDPNVLRIRFQRKMLFVAARDIAKDEELCITYINAPRHSKSERSELLREHYDFDCSCDTCVNNLSLEQTLCEKCGCSSFLDQHCAICDAKILFEKYE
jgi:hypothetical protein